MQHTHTTHMPRGSSLGISLLWDNILSDSLPRNHKLYLSRSCIHPTGRVVLFGLVLTTDPRRWDLGDHEQPRRGARTHTHTHVRIRTPGDVGDGRKLTAWPFGSGARGQEPSPHCAPESDPDSELNHGLGWCSVEDEDVKGKSLSGNPSKPISGAVSRHSPWGRCVTPCTCMRAEDIWLAGVSWARTRLGNKMR